MSVDKLVDSTQLDSDLTSVANAIRAKSGGSSQLAFPAGFVSEIQAIPSGGGDPEWYSTVSKLGGFSISGASVSGSTVFDFGDFDVDGLMLGNSKILNDDTELEVKCRNLQLATGAFSRGNNYTNKLYTVRLTCNNNPSTTSQMTQSSYVKRILGSPLRCESLSQNVYRHFNSTNLVEFYLVPNVLISGGSGTNPGLNTGVLVDASIVSVANALKGGLATPQTLTIYNAATKAKCSTIVGTVSQVTEDGETYDFFTQDDSGTVTLADFITQTKGWTLA